MSRILNFSKVVGALVPLKKKKNLQLHLLNNNRQYLTVSDEKK